MKKKTSARAQIQLGGEHINFLGANMNVGMLNLMSTSFKSYKTALSILVRCFAREPARTEPSQRRARAEPHFPARETNEPARAEPISSELNSGSHRAQADMARVQP
jgi:hypothetical protein